MDYEELYDESPYVSKEILRRGGLMPIMRATFLICATILASVFAVMFYGYQQDQFVITSNGNFVSIFDRKSRTINLCDKGNCTLVTPMFETQQATIRQGSPISQAANPQQGAQPGQRLIGSFPQPQGPANAQAQAQPQQAQAQTTGGNPQAQQMLQQLEQMEVMAQRTANTPMNPQRIQFIRQRRALEDQALAARLLNPQMIQQVRQLRAIEDQQLAQAQQQATAQPAAASNPAGNAAGNQAAASETAAEETTSEEAAADENPKAEKTAEEPAAAEETEEAAPV